MSRTFRVFALFASGTILLSFAVLVLNQTAQVVQFASVIHPTLGTATLATLLATYAGLVGVPLVMVLRLPSPLIPPENENGPEFDAHLKKLGERLVASPLLAGRDLSDRHGIEDALDVLAARTNEIVRQTATGVFLATAVSQSGRLDGLVVLAAQSRMVWKIAHLYSQRPAARDMMHLYANVAGTAFVAGELQEIDLGEQVEPVVSAALSALGASLPGLQVAGAVLTNCVLDGSANAFLTLRVGMDREAILRRPRGRRQGGRPTSRDRRGRRLPRRDRRRRQCSAHEGGLEVFDGQGRRRSFRRFRQAPRQGPLRTPPRAVRSGLNGPSRSSRRGG